MYVEIHGTDHLYSFGPNTFLIGEKILGMAFFFSEFLKIQKKKKKQRPSRFSLLHMIATCRACVYVKYRFSPLDCLFVYHVKV